METTVVIIIALVSFIVGMFLSPKWAGRKECELDHDMFPLIRPVEPPSYREEQLLRENMSLRNENLSLRWQYEKLKSYGGRECCEHCHINCIDKKNKEELEKVVNQMKGAQLTAKELIEKLKF